MPTPLYVAIADLLIEREESSKTPGYAIHRANIKRLVNRLLSSHMGPKGHPNPGVMVTFGLRESTAEQLVFACDFPHLDGIKVTTHQIIVTPSLKYGFKLQITGKDLDGAKGRLEDILRDALMRDVQPLERSLKMKFQIPKFPVLSWRWDEWKPQRQIKRLVNRLAIPAAIYWAPANGARCVL